MPHVRLILALHNHQPVGNFAGVFEEAYRTSYLPFLETLDLYPEIPFALHTSGPLIEWLIENRPDYVDRLRARVQAGQVEIIGGAYQEPILPMIPPRDRVAQIRDFRDFLEDLFTTKVKGMWLAERVWEQALASSIVDAGAVYTILDDVHFERAGVARERLTSYWLTEDDGRLLRVFPASETLRYTMPFEPPHSTYLHLKSLAEKNAGATVVFADDGEKFGSWPKTFDHVYTNGWLRHFCDMLMGNRDWIEPTLPGKVLEQTLPAGKIYLPDGSYREMTEWALDVESARVYRRASERVSGLEEAAAARRFFRPGGFWRNFKARYPESDEMYARMMMVSRRLEGAMARDDADPDYLEVARRELHRGQCNCPYWHGSFGGLYLPHLRGAVYRALITAESALDDALGGRSADVSIDVADFNLDGRQEVRLENRRLIALVRPAQGGQLYELDDRRTATNLLATLERRPEIYHDAVRKSGGDHEAAGEHKVDGVLIKDDGLDGALVYDRLPRKAFVDHFLDAAATLDDLALGGDSERGDFALGAYLSKVRRDPGECSVIMERSGRAAGHAIRIKKTIALQAESCEIKATYELDGLPAGESLHCAVEINLAAMAGHAQDRFYAAPGGHVLGMLDTQLDLPETDGVALADQWLDLKAELSWSTPGRLWCFPIETVSLSEGGCERVYQSSAVVPHWRVVGDENGRWSVVIRLALGPVKTAPNPAQARARQSQPALP